MIIGQPDNLNFPFSLLAAATVRTEPRTALIERENYQEYTFEYIIGGSGFLEIDGESFEPRAGSMYILSLGSSHRYWPNRENPWEKIFFAIKGGMVDYLLSVYRLEKLHYLPDCPELLKYFEAMHRLGYHGEDVNHQAAAIFHQFLAATAQIVYGQELHLPLELEKLKAELDAHLERPFVLEDYCRDNDCSAAHLIRTFRQNFGDTPYGYLMKRRLELAQRLLLYSHFSIKEIAGRLCFSDQYYFSNYFKRKTGVSPRRFRKDS